MEAEKLELLDKCLFDFQDNNPHATVNFEDEVIQVLKPWGLSDCILVSKIDNDNFIKCLNSLTLPTNFDAIFHNEENIMEFIYMYVEDDSSEKNPIYNRSFVVHFEGVQYDCRFGEPTYDFNTIVSTFERLPHDPSTSSSVYQIDQFIDAKRTDLPDFVAEYFKGKKPCNFHVKANKPLNEIDIEKAAKHINFIMSYYDRESPIISIQKRNETKQAESIEPIRFIDGKFPKKTYVNEIDSVILRLLEVGTTNNPRFSFLYYYQVLEYAAHHYIDEKCKLKIKSILKDPTIISCEEKAFEKLFEALTDRNHDETHKMKKVLEEHCDPKEVWKEITNNRSFFEQEQVFEGGVIIKPLIHKETNEDSWPGMWMPKLHDQLSKIRNTIVHAKERREPKAILPTKENNLILKNYCPVVERIAKQIAIKT